MNLQDILVCLTCSAADFLVGGLGFLAAATSLRSWPTLRPKEGLTLGTLEKETANSVRIVSVAMATSLLSKTCTCTHVN